MFDALNDIRNVVDNAEAIKEVRRSVRGSAISCTISPVHTLDSSLGIRQQLKDLGDTIAIKDMAGILTPYRAECGCGPRKSTPPSTAIIGGMASANILKAVF